MNNWLFKLKDIAKKMWFRCCLYCLFALFAFFSGSTLGEYVPNGLKEIITTEGVSDILKILASSMLAVTTFSLSIMVQAFSTAATTATPRANKLLMEDSTAQNALGSFIGAFLFSIVGIIGINSNIYDQDIIVVLFLFTLIMIFVIIVMLLRWIDQLSKLGRVTVTIDLVEKALHSSITARAHFPVLCCKELVASEYDFDHRYHPVVINEVGYVQHIDMSKLDELAKSKKIEIFVIAKAYCTSPINAQLVQDIGSCFIVGGDRTFQQDPRYGFVILAEIALRALSPGTNDPGTAIDIIGTYVRCTRHWTTSFHGENSVSVKDHEQIKYSNIYIPRINEEEIFEDMFSALVADASDHFVVSVRLKKCLLSISKIHEEIYAEVAHYWLDSLTALCKTKLSDDEYKQFAGLV